MLTNQQKQQLQQLLGERVKFAASLKSLTSMRIGGICDVLAYPKEIGEIRQLLAICKAATLPFRIIGGGTNLLVPDRGFSGMIITTTQMNQYHFEKPGSLQAITPTGAQATDRFLLYSDAGVRISKLIYACTEEALTGLEFAAGIPGTFGGVLWMNAGTRGGSIHQVFHSMDIVTPEGELRLLSAAEVTFTYRSSNLPSNHFILGGRVWVRPGDRNEINSEVAKIKAYRQNQPLEWPNAGSVFKNPKGDHAGRLIEACGLKGFRSGGAMISDKHANFIVNVENATADDVMKIIHKVQETVLKEHGVQLETEVELLQ